MGRSLYVAIDESGREADDDIFTTASCWYVSTQPPESALNPVRESLQGLLTDCGYPASNRELKGTDLQEDQRQLFFDSIRRAIDKDSNSIKREHTLWDGYHVGFRFSGLPAKEARATLRHPSDTISPEQTIRRTMLLEQLMPLFTASFNLEYISNVVILLDGTVWADAQRNLSENASIPYEQSLEYEFGDSVKLKGIQFADVVANTLRRSYIEDGHAGKLSTLEDFSIP